MKTGWSGGDLSARAVMSLLSPTICQGSCRGQGMGRISGDREPFCDHGRKTEGGRHGQA